MNPIYTRLLYILISNYARFIQPGIYASDECYSYLLKNNIQFPAYIEDGPLFKELLSFLAAASATGGFRLLDTFFFIAWTYSNILLPGYVFMLVAAAACFIIIWG